MQGILYCSISAFKTLFNQAALRAVLKSVDRYLDLFQSITKHWSYIILYFKFICCFFGIRESPSRALCLYLALDLRIQSKPRKMKRQRTIAIRSMRIRQLTTDSRSFPKLTPSCETMSRLRV